MVAFGLQAAACTSADSDGDDEVGGAPSGGRAVTTGGRAGTGGSVARAGQPSTGGTQGGESSEGFAGEGGAEEASAPTSGGTGGSAAGAGGANSVPTVDMKGEVIGRLSNGNFAIAGPRHAPTGADVVAYDIAEITSTGETIWSKTIVESPCTTTAPYLCLRAEQLRATPAGGILLAGSTPVAIGDQTQASALDRFFIELDSSGELVWAHQEGSSALEFWLGGGDDAGNAYVYSPGQVVRYDDDGSTSWTSALQSNWTENGLPIYRHLTTDLEGTTYLLVDRSPSTLDRNSPSVAELWRFDSDGEVLPTWPLASAEAGASSELLSAASCTVEANEDGSAVYAVAHNALFKVDASGETVFEQDVGPPADVTGGGWRLVVAPDDSAAYVFEYEISRGMKLERYAGSDGKLEWSTFIPTPAATSANGINSSLAVDADNEQLMILYGTGVGAMPTSGEGMPVRVLNFR